MELAVTSTASIANPNVGDLMLSDLGEEVVLNDLASEVAQRLRVRFSFFKGEWFLDLNAGTPWYQSILVKAPADRIVRSVFRSVILDTEGVADLLELTYNVSPQRVMSLRFKARLEDGTIFRSTEYAPFVVTT